MKTPVGTTAPAELGYEQARDELVEVVRLLEQGGLDLDASLALWERGEALAARCEEHLAGARTRVESALAKAAADADRTQHQLHAREKST